jgi:hypothetical protein
MEKEVAPPNEIFNEVEQKRDSRIKGGMLMATLLISLAILLFLKGNLLIDFWQSVREIGLWNALIHSIGSFAATGLLIESIYGLGLLAIGLTGLFTMEAGERKLLGRSAGEWVLSFLVFIVAVGIAVVAELLTIIPALAASPVSWLIIILILLLSLLWIIAASLVFLGPLIVWGVNSFGCIWIKWLERQLKQIVDTIKILIPIWNTYLKKVVTRIVRWEKRTRNTRRQVRRRTCTSWNWALRWLCISWTYVTEWIIVAVSFWAQVIVEAVRYVTVTALTWIVEILTFIRVIVILVARMILFCW